MVWNSLLPFKQNWFILGPACNSMLTLLLTTLVFQTPHIIWTRENRLHRPSSNLHAFCMFFMHFFLNHALRMYTSLMASFMHFRKNFYIKCSNYYIEFTKPCHPCCLSSNNNEHPTHKHVLSNSDWHFMIKQTWLKQTIKFN